MNAIKLFPRRGAIALFLTTVGLALLLSFKTPTTTSPTAFLAANETAPSSNGGSTTGSTGSTGSTATTATSGGLKAGTYTGNAVSIGYGTVQVQVTVANGKISNVSILQYPNGGRSGQIAQSSLPTLISETLSAQSARISSVSGATFTSQGYTQSLQSALDQANA